MSAFDITEISRKTKKGRSVKNTVIPPNFLIWKFCGKAQFPDSFGRIAGSGTFWETLCSKVIRILNGFLFQKIKT